MHSGLDGEPSATDRRDRPAELDNLTTFARFAPCAKKSSDPNLIDAWLLMRAAYRRHNDSLWPSTSCRRHASGRQDDITSVDLDNVKGAPHLYEAPYQIHERTAGYDHSLILAKP